MFDEMHRVTSLLHEPLRFLLQQQVHRRLAAAEVFEGHRSRIRCTLGRRPSHLPVRQPPGWTCRVLSLTSAAVGQTSSLTVAVESAALARASSLRFSATCRAASWRPSASGGRGSRGTAPSTQDLPALKSRSKRPFQRPVRERGSVWRGRLTARVNDLVELLPWQPSRASGRRIATQASACPLSTVGRTPPLQSGEPSAGGLEGLGEGKARAWLLLMRSPLRGCSRSTCAIT